MKMSLDPNTLLSHLPSGLRNELFEAYRNIETNFREARWEPSELNGGKLCEIAYSIIRGHADGALPPHASKPGNMLDACKAMENAGASLPRSIRIQIPRMLIALYEIRNNRGVGHVGGDVNPNHMDALCVLQMSKWVFAELIRLFHSVSSDEAAAMVDSLSEREISLIWKVGDVSRILDQSFSMQEKTLLLLYAAPSGLTEAELVRSIEHSNASVYRRDVLKKAHKARLLEYDQKSRLAIISPLGSRLVEKTMLSK